MLKKHRQLILGILIGSILTATVAFAADTLTAQLADFPIVVDGKAVELDMPVVTIQDRTYLPLRALGDVLGVKVDWNDEKQQAEVSTGAATPAPTAVPGVNKYIPTEKEIAESNDGIREIGGVYYVMPVYIDKVFYDKGYKGKIDSNTNTVTYTKDGLNPITIQFEIVDNFYAAITYDYFIDYVLPLIQ